MMKHIFESKKSYLNWVVDNYHTEVVNNAISAGLLTSDVDRETLYYVLCNALEGGGIDQVMYSINVPLNLSQQSKEVQAQFARNFAPKKSEYNYTVTGEGTNSIDESSQSSIDDQYGTFDWNQFGDIFNTAANVFGTIWGAVSPNQNPAPGPGNGNNNLPAPPPPADNTNMILIIAAVLMVVVLIVVLFRGKK